MLLRILTLVVFLNRLHKWKRDIVEALTSSPHHCFTRALGRYLHEPTGPPLHEGAGPLLRRSAGPIASTKALGRCFHELARPPLHEGAGLLLPRSAGTIAAIALLIAATDCVIAAIGQVIAATGHVIAAFARQKKTTEPDTKFSGATEPRGFGHEDPRSSKSSIPCPSLPLTLPLSFFPFKGSRTSKIWDLHAQTPEAL